MGERGKALRVTLFRFASEQAPGVTLYSKKSMGDPPRRKMLPVVNVVAGSGWWVEVRHTLSGGG